MEAEAWRDPRRGAVTLRTYSGHWLAERTVRGRPLARRTLDTYQNSLARWILPQLGDIELRQLTAPRIRQWHATISERTGPTATRQAYALLRAILNTAVDDELIRRNPCRMRGAGQPVMKERPLLDLDQVERLRLAMPEHLQGLVAVTFWAHLRIGEVVALQRGDFDRERRALRIERQQIELRGGGSEITPPKAGSRRLTHRPTRPSRRSRTSCAASARDCRPPGCSSGRTTRPSASGTSSTPGARQPAASAWKACTSTTCGTPG